MLPTCLFSYIYFISHSVLPCRKRKRKKKCMKMLDKMGSDLLKRVWEDQALPSQPQPKQNSSIPFVNLLGVYCFFSFQMFPFLFTKPIITLCLSHHFFVFVFIFSLSSFHMFSFWGKDLTFSLDFTTTSFSSLIPKRPNGLWFHLDPILWWTLQVRPISSSSTLNFLKKISQNFLYLSFRFLYSQTLKDL